MVKEAMKMKASKKSISLGLREERLSEKCCNYVLISKTKRKNMKVYIIIRKNKTGIKIKLVTIPSSHSANKE